MAYDCERPWSVVGGACTHQQEVVFSLAIRRLYGEPVYPLESLAPVTAGETTDDTKAEDVVADEVFDDGSVRCVGQAVRSPAVKGKGGCHSLMRAAANRGADRFHEPASVLQAYEMTMRRTYLFQRGIGKLAALAGASLKSGGYEAACQWCRASDVLFVNTVCHGLTYARFWCPQAPVLCWW